MTRTEGKLIVLDGTDGSGKATQAAMLVRRLKREGHRVRTIDFPQYEQNFFGKLIGECLTGAYGDFLGIDPHIASVLYAADRFESAARLRRWLAAGAIVIADRYVSSNQIHQGGKITDTRRRRAFLAWLDRMEYGVFQIPRPQVILYLDVPVAFTQELLKEKDLAAKKTYLKSGKDQAEGDVAHLEAARKSAIRLVQASNNWIRIECVRRGVLLSKQEIHDRICENILPLI